MAHRVTLIPGDGTGPELTEATRRVLEATGVEFDWDVQPAGEEVMFRGFLFRGWARSERSAWPAIVVISILWAVLHVQYDWAGMLQIFIVGLFLGWIRWRSGSTLLTFVLHALFNLEATAETVVLMRFFS